MSNNVSGSSFYRSTAIIYCQAGAIEQFTRDKSLANSFTMPLIHQGSLKVKTELSEFQKNPLKLSEDRSGIYQ